MKRDYAVFPPYLKLFATCGVWLPFPALALTGAASLIAAFLFRRYPWSAEWTMILMTIAFVLWKGIAVHAG